MYWNLLQQNKFYLTHLQKLQKEWFDCCQLLHSSFNFDTYDYDAIPAKQK